MKTYLLCQILQIIAFSEAVSLLFKRTTQSDDCDFDNDAEPFCHWKNAGTELKFIRNSGATTSYSTGPPGDHSKHQNGSYVYLEASNAKYGHRAQIISRKFKPTVRTTLKFYTFMYGSTVNYLRIVIKKERQELEELWKISGNQGKAWLPVEVQYISLVPYQIIIEAAAGRSFQSDIAIDDVQFIKDDAPFSGWSQWNSWTVCKRKNNWCQKERFRLCLEKDATLCGVKSDEKVQKQVSSCSLLSCKVDGHWSLWGKWSKCSSGCEAGWQVRRRLCNEPKPMHGGKDCNGHSEETMTCWNGFCKRGSDDCDFDNDANPMCHWRNVNGTLGFHRKNLWTGTAGTGPQGDHSNNTHGKYIYLESSSPAKYGQIGQIASKIFPAIERRTLKFYVYMHGKTVNYLRVLIRTSNSSRELWRVDGNHGKKWILGRVDYSCPVPYRILFEAAVGKNFQSDIALDTIHFEDVVVKLRKTEVKPHRSHEQKVQINHFVLLTFAAILLTFL